MLGLLSFLHQRFAFALIVMAAVLGLWGSYQFLRRRAVSGGFRATYLMMAALTLIQGLLGAAAFAAHGHPREILHIVYGIFAIAFLPAMYVWGAAGSRDREAFLLPFSCWIVAVAYVRGWFTGY